MKRIVDLVLATLLFIPSLPLMVVIAILIVLTSPGGVLFFQERIGREGKPFRCIKFRTMVPNATQLLEQDPELQKQWSLHHKLTRDPRTTRLGEILRKSSLDELPQLWNVIRGEMSLVGPRPLLPHELEGNSSLFLRVLSVPPGMTGLAQTSGRSKLTFSQRLRYDLEYVNSRTLKLDLRLLWITIPTVLTGRGAC